jgi:hypothetical protein
MGRESDNYGFISKTSVVILALTLSVTTARAQNNLRAQASSATGSNAIPGCTNADDLVKQADDVIDKLRKITPADWSSDPLSLSGTLGDLKGHSELLHLQLQQCYLDMWNTSEEAMQLSEDSPKIVKMSKVAMMSDYLDFVYQTRFTGGDKSYLAFELPTSMDQIPECKGVPALLPKVDNFIAQYKTDEAQAGIMPRDVDSYLDHGKKLLDCALGMEKIGYSAAAARLYTDVAAIDGFMVMADSHVEANL